VAELAAQSGIEFLEARREQDRADAQGFRGRLHVVHDRTGRARLHALAALTAQTASQATLGLGHGVLVGVADVDLAEAAHALLGARLLHLVPLDLWRVRIGGRRHFLGLASRERGALLRRSPAQVAVDRSGGPVALGHRIDQRGRSGGRVATSEDSWEIRGQGRAVRDDAPARAGGQRRHDFDALADGDDHRVGFQAGHLRVVERGSKPALLVEYARASAELHARRLCHSG
jgi:hypothetical protein